MYGVYDRSAREFDENSMGLLRYTVFSFFEHVYFKYSIRSAQPVAPCHGIVYIFLMDTSFPYGCDALYGHVHSHVEFMQHICSLLHRFLSGPALLVFLHEALHELGVDGTTLAKHIVSEVRSIDSLQLLGGTLVNAHDLVKAHPEAGLVFIHA